jgi:hypothetical protein
VILYRCFAWRADVRPDAADGGLWFPRPFQGEGRHDNPDLYGCLYLADRPVSCIVEQFAPFRGQRLIASMLQRRGLPLALGSLEIADAVALIDLDDPRQLTRERLRPSHVATRDRAVTQPQARQLYHRHPHVGGLRWWSSWEAQWMNLTLFDRASRALRLVQVEALTLAHPAVVEAAEFFGLRPA